MQPEPLSVSVAVLLLVLTACLFRGAGRFLVSVFHVAFTYRVQLM